MSLMFVTQCLTPVFVILSSGVFNLEVDCAAAHMETGQSGKLEFNFPDKNQGEFYFITE